MDVDQRETGMRLVRQRPKNQAQCAPMIGYVYSIVVLDFNRLLIYC